MHRPDIAGSHVDHPVATALAADRRYLEPLGNDRRPGHHMRVGGIRGVDDENPPADGVAASDAAVRQHRNAGAARHPRPAVGVLVAGGGDVAGADERIHVRHVVALAENRNGDERPGDVVGISNLDLSDHGGDDRPHGNDRRPVGNARLGVFGGDNDMPADHVAGKDVFERDCIEVGAVHDVRPAVGILVADGGDVAGADKHLDVGEKGAVAADGDGDVRPRDVVGVGDLYLADFGLDAGNGAGRLRRVAVGAEIDALTVGVRLVRVGAVRVAGVDGGRVVALVLVPRAVVARHPRDGAEVYVEIGVGIASVGNSVFTDVVGSADVGIAGIGAAADDLDPRGEVFEAGGEQRIAEGEVVAGERGGGRDAHIVGKRNAEIVRILRGKAAVGKVEAARPAHMDIVPDAGHGLLAVAVAEDDAVVHVDFAHFDMETARDVEGVAEVVGEGAALEIDLRRRRRKPDVDCSSAVRHRRCCLKSCRGPAAPVAGEGAVGERRVPTRSRKQNHAASAVVCARCRSSTSDRAAVAAEVAVPRRKRGPAHPDAVAISLVAAGG